MTAIGDDSARGVASGGHCAHPEGTKHLASVAPNIAVVREFIDAINRWDFAALRDLCDEDEYVFTLPFVHEGVPSRVKGRDAWLSVAKQWRKQLEGERTSRSSA